MNLEQSVLIDPFKGKIKENESENIKNIKYNKKIETLLIESEKIIKQNYKEFFGYVFGSYNEVIISDHIIKNKKINSIILNSEEINLFSKVINYKDEYQSESLYEVVYGLLINNLFKKSLKKLSLNEYIIDLNKELKYIGTNITGQPETKTSLIINCFIGESDEFLEDLGFNNKNLKIIINGDIADNCLKNNENCDLIINGYIYGDDWGNNSKNCNFIFNGLIFSYMNRLKLDTYNCSFQTESKKDYIRLSKKVLPSKGNIIRLVDKSGNVIEEIKK